MSGKAIILVGFGSPLSPNHAEEFLREVMGDESASPLCMFGALCKPAAFLISKLCGRSYRKKYKAKMSWAQASRFLIEAFRVRLETRLRAAGSAEPGVFVAMRYGKPGIEETLKAALDRGAERVVVVPLFPQYAKSTVGSICLEAESKSEKLGTRVAQIKVIRSWCRETRFIAAWSDSIKKTLEQFETKSSEAVHLLFSAHSIPLFHVKGGDIYPYEIKESAKLVASEMGPRFSMSIAYQSAHGFGRWLGPCLEEEIVRLGKSGVKKCVIVPISFLYDCSETWCDVDEHVLPLARKFGFETIARAIPPIEEPGVLDAIAALVR